ncbi:MAG: hypothetical protein K0Q73_2989 [Paenibacillus sp.]|nr:hypothetical protein [Paenibacillus sp.]
MECRGKKPNAHLKAFGGLWKKAAITEEEFNYFMGVGKGETTWETKKSIQFGL